MLTQSRVNIYKCFMFVTISFGTLFKITVSSSIAKDINLAYLLFIINTTCSTVVQKYKGHIVVTLVISYLS